LTWIGGSFYPNVDTTTNETARRSWEQVAAQITDTYNATGHPVFMAEVGAGGMSDAQMTRWVTTMFEVLGPLSSWAGFSWWRWAQNPATPMSLPVQAAFAKLAKQWARPCAA
jgi:hypothetical protein